MKVKYETPTMELIQLMAEDVITASGWDPENDETEILTF